MILSKLFIILLLSILTLIIGSYYYVNKQLLFPGFIMIIWWDIFIFFFLIFDDYKYPYYGVLHIILSIACYEIGSFGFSRIRVSELSFTNQVNFNYKFTKKWITIISIVLIIPIIHSFIQEGGLQRGLIATVADHAYNYYTTEEVHSLVDSIINQITGIAIYGNSLLGGIYFLGVEKKNKKYASIVFLPGILQTITTSGKLSFIISVFMFAIGIIVYRLKSPESVTFISYWHIIKKYGVLGIGALFMLFLSLLFRFGQINSYYIDVTKRKFVNYAFGSVAAFNIWFNSREIDSLGYGSHTFTGILNAFGFVKRERGVYTKFATSDFWNTNVYTAYRGLISDFGIFGSLVFMMILGAISGYAYNSYTQKKTYGSLCVLSYCYLYIMFSFLNSPFVYLNLSIFVPVLLFIYCYFQKNYNTKNKALGDSLIGGAQK